MADSRIAFNTDSSAAVQGDIGVLIGTLEQLISARDQQVNNAMADFQADGVSEEYHQVELRWKRASGEVREIINLVKTTLAKNDETAVGAQTRASNAVASI